MFCWISWLHVDRFSWDFYNRDSFDETIKNLLYLEDLFYHPLPVAFNLRTHTHIHTYIHTFGFIEKTSVKQDLNCKVCSNFQMSFLHLVRRTQNRWGFRSGWHFCQIFSSGWPLVRHMPTIRLWVRLTFGHTLGQADLWSDVPSRSGFGQVDIWATLGQAELWSDVPARFRLWVRLTFGHTLGQADFWLGVPPMIRLWVRLTFGYTLGQANLWSNIPPGRDILWSSVLLLQFNGPDKKESRKSGCH